jgi:hypothetical protein
MYDYFTRTLTIANKMTFHGERMKLVTLVEKILVVEKILRSIPAKFNYVSAPLKNPTMWPLCP